MESQNDSINEPRIKNVIYEKDLSRYLLSIFKLAAPATLSAVFGQLTYILNLFKADKISSKE